jgi:hypothetical protein
MATEIIVQIPAEFLGPESEYARRRIALRRQWGELVEAAKRITVTDAASCEEATKAGRVLQASLKELDSFYTPIKREIDAIKKPVLANEAEDTAAINDQKIRLGAEITRFNHEQERIRREAERAAREAIERQAREEALARAVELEAEGDLQAAEALLDEPVTAPVIIQAAQPPKVSGQVAKVAYSMEVTDLKLLVKAVANGEAPLAAIQANESFLNGRARLDREAYAIPGTKLVRKEATHFRS